MANIYFSEFFGVSSDALEEYGAFDVSLLGDLPLFVDPFLLFNSEVQKYQELHSEIICYMRFLKTVTLTERLTDSLIIALFSFPEVKQNWLGFSLNGNEGHGLGKGFAHSLHHNFTSVFRDFGEETVTRSSHLEKLCLIRDGVGRDNISDFSTNLIKGYLAEYTQAFAQNNIKQSLRRIVAVPKVRFNYQTRTWVTQTYDLPFIHGDYVLLTPKSILTKDEAWINRADLMDRIAIVANALPDAVLRAQVNDYLFRVLPKNPNATKEEFRNAVTSVIDKFPQVLDYYIRDKENTGDEAVSLSKSRVQAIETWFVNHVRNLVKEFLEPIGFYNTSGNTYDEAKTRIMYLKDVIENKGGHKIFYFEGQPIGTEAALQILYRFTWYATPSDLSREVNDGRGPADFKVSRGAADKVLVEFKLAKNTHLEQNLAKQSEIYEKASDATHPSLKVILYFSEDQLQRVNTILKRLKLTDNPHIILIDANADNKPSGSKA